MIISLILKPFWLFVSFLIRLEFDFMTEIPNWYPQFRSLMQIGLSVFPIDVWVIVIANLAFWMTIHLSGAVIEWLYKKIPGVS